MEARCSHFLPQFLPQNSIEMACQVSAEFGGMFALLG
jgi:hypothetical protein